MAVSYIGASSVVATNGGAPGAITPHASTAVGDLLVFFHYSNVDSDTETVTPPTGFTSVFNARSNLFGLICVATRIYQSGDTTFTASVTNHTSSTSGDTILEWIETYRGIDTANPIVNFTAANSTWASSTSIGSIAAPATATVNDGDMVVVFGGRRDNVTGQTTLTGDNLTWNNNTIGDTNLGRDAGAVTQRGLNSSGSNQTVTAKTITTTGTAQAGAGRMFIIEKALSTTYFQTLSTSAPAAATLSRLATFPRTLSATQLAGATLTKVATFPRTFSTSATALATLVATRLQLISMSATAAASATLSQVTTFVRTLATSAAATATLIAAATFYRALSSSAAAAGTLSKKLFATLSSSALASATLALGRLFTRTLNATLGAAASTADTVFNLTRRKLMKKTNGSNYIELND